MSDNSQIIATLKAARSELANRGRCRDVLQRGKKVCIVGAVNATGVTHRDFFLAIQALENQLLKMGLGRYASIYNDDPKTTDQDVFNLFDKTLAELGGLG